MPLVPLIPSAFVVALANCTREEIKGTPVGCGLFLCSAATVGDRGLEKCRQWMMMLQEVRFQHTQQING